MLMNVQVMKQANVTRTLFVPTLKDHMSVAASKDTLETVKVV